MLSGEVMSWIQGIILGLLVLNLTATASLRRHTDRRDELVVIRAEAFEQITVLAIQEAYALGREKCRHQPVISRW